MAIIEGIAAFLANSPCLSDHSPRAVCFASLQSQLILQTKGPHSHAVSPQQYSGRCTKVTRIVRGMKKESLMGPVSPGLMSERCFHQYSTISPIYWLSEVITIVGLWLVSLPMFAYLFEPSEFEETKERQVQLSRETRYF